MDRLAASEAAGRHRRQRDPVDLRDQPDRAPGPRTLRRSGERGRAARGGRARRRAPGGGRRLPGRPSPRVERRRAPNVRRGQRALAADLSRARHLEGKVLGRSPRRGRGRRPRPDRRPALRPAGGRARGRAGPARSPHHRGQPGRLRGASGHGALGPHGALPARGPRRQDRGGRDHRGRRGRQCPDRSLPLCRQGAGGHRGSHPHGGAHRRGSPPGPRRGQERGPAGLVRARRSAGATEASSRSPRGRPSG